MIRTATGEGTTYRRVCDLLAGWAAYVAEEAKNATSVDERRMYLAENTAISRIYNDLACLSGTYDDLDRDALHRLEELVRDLVLHGAPAHGKAEGGT